LSWFGAGPTGASQQDDTWTRGGMAGWDGTHSPDPDLPAPTGHGAASRTYFAFLSARVVLALALLVVMGGAALMGVGTASWLNWVAGVYALAALAVRLIPQRWIQQALAQGPLRLAATSTRKPCWSCLC
jgi:hypothetical protein